MSLISLATTVITQEKLEIMAICTIVLGRGGGGGEKVQHRLSGEREFHSYEVFLRHLFCDQ